MNPLKRILARLKSRLGVLKDLILPTPPPEPTLPPIEDLLPKGQIRAKARQTAEKEADLRAIWAISNAINNPDDFTAQEGRRQAIEYLTRSQALKGKGSLQDFNRERIARRWIKSDLATEKGQEERKKKALDQFNANMNINLTEDTYDTMKSIMDSPAFQKALDRSGEFYKLLYGAVGDAIDQDADPQRIEQTLDMFVRGSLDDYELFTDIMDINGGDFNRMYMDITGYSDTAIGAGLSQEAIREGVSSIIEDYLA